MLDPITGFGLAVNVIQVIEFASRVLDDVREIRRDGTLQDVTDLETLNSDIQGALSTIKRTATINNSANNLSEDDKRVLDLTSRTSTETQKLEEEIQKLQHHGGRGRIASFRTAMRPGLRKEKLDNLAKRQTMLREQLQLSILATLQQNSVLEAQSSADRHRNLNQEQKDLLLLILTKCEEQDVSVASYSTALLRRIDESESTLMLGINEIKSQLPSMSPVNFSQSTCSAGMTNPTVTVSPMVQKRTRNDLLRHLKFPTMYDRQDQVSPAFATTFDWILKTSDTRPQKWDNFMEWLRCGNGCYWINGKAASGKSTLMKYLEGRAIIKTTLREWGGSNELHLGSFYFWNSGTTDQKSQAGLLRSLLYSVGREFPNLLDIAYPDLYESAIDFADNIGNHRTQDWSGDIGLRPVKRAFQNLIQNLPHGYTLCFFVDGLDEYEGDHEELAIFFKAIANPKVKFVLSSRPIPACLKVFEDCAQLRLQDLTEDDISHYINEQIRQHKTMKRLLLKRPENAQKFIEQIIKRAQGVFLWVILVVKSLIRSLDNHDTLHELTARMLKYPTELDGLYGHMMDLMDESYQQQAIEYLQIVLYATELQESNGLRLLQMSFAEQEGRVALPGDDFEVPDTDEICAREAAMEARLISRCCGLLETSNHNEYNEDRLPGVYFGCNVIFLHKSVVDFLRQSSVWERRIQSVVEKGFVPELCLARSLICMLRTYPSDEAATERIHNHLVTYCGRLDKVGLCANPLMEAYRNCDPTLGERKAWPRARDVAARFVKSKLLFFTWYGYANSVKAVLAENKLAHLDDAECVTFLQSISPGHDALWTFDDLAVRAVSIEILLDHGFDPNMSLENTTPWIRLLTGITWYWDVLAEYHWPIILAFFRLIRSFLKHGADTNLVLEGQLFVAVADLSNVENRYVQREQVELHSTERSVKAWIEILLPHFANQPYLDQGTKLKLEEYHLESMAILKSRDAESWRSSNAPEHVVPRKAPQRRWGPIGKFDVWREERKKKRLPPPDPNLVIPNPELSILYNSRVSPVLRTYYLII